MKFESVLNSELSQAVKLLERVKALSNLCGKQLSDVIDECAKRKLRFCVTALHFNRLNYEAIDSVFMLLKAGHLGEAFVLLRWLLELCHLFYYLWKNEEEYKKWLSGAEIRLEKIGKFFQQAGLATWKESYVDWSNVTHANSAYIEHCFSVSRMKPVNRDQVLVLSQAMRNLMYIAHKINYVSGNFLKELLDVSQYNDIAREYNSLEDLIETFSDEHNKREGRRMKELDNK